MKESMLKILMYICVGVSIIFSMVFAKILKGAIIVPAICFYTAHKISQKTIKKNTLIIPTFTVQLGHIIWILLGYIVLYSTKIVEINGYIKFYLILTAMQFGFLIWLLLKETNRISFVSLVVINTGHAITMVYGMNLLTGVSDQEVMIQIMHLLIRLVAVGTLIFYSVEQKKKTQKFET